MNTYVGAWKLYPGVHVGSLHLWLYWAKRLNLHCFYDWLKIAGELGKSGKCTNFPLQYKITKKLKIWVSAELQLVFVYKTLNLQTCICDKIILDITNKQEDIQTDIFLLLIYIYMYTYKLVPLSCITK